MLALLAAIAAAVTLVVVLFGVVVIGPINLTVLALLFLALWAVFLVWPGR